VFTTTTANPTKVARIELLGAEVVRVGPDLAAARAAATASDPGTYVIADGTVPDLAEGAGTIAQELTRAGEYDAVAVPVGDGSLISGVALWMRTHAPGTRIIGVNPRRAPAMHESLRASRPVSVEVVAPFAEGISIPRPHAESLGRVRALIDDIVLVDDDQILDAMAAVSRCLSVVAEPAGAAGIAAIAAGLVPGHRVATIITGANPSPATLSVLARHTRNGRAA
jgi:threonine dehydratase